MGEQILVLPKKALFGPDLEDMFNGIVSDPANPIQQDRGYISLEEMYKRYKLAFESGKDNNNLFYDKNIIDTNSGKLEHLLQIVTYSIFVTKEAQKLYIFASDIKDGKSLKAEKLGGLINVGWGGHISDIRYNEWTKNGTIPNPFLLIQDTHTRELAEEVKIQNHFTYVRHLGWIYLPEEKDGISPYHLGHINIVKIPYKKSLLTIQQNETKVSVNPRWILLEEIAQSTKQAAWTRFIVPIIGFLNQQNLI